MEYRTLGRTGLRVSVMGFGGGGIGGVWGATTDDECVRAVQKACDLGINFFDVAPGYGNGKAEENLGVGLRGRRQEVYVATKVRLRHSELSDVATAIRASVEQSLRLLQTDYVDLLQLHNRVRIQRLASDNSLEPEDVIRRGGVQDVFQQLRDEGKVRFLGLTGYGDIEALTHVVEHGWFDTVQVHYNLIHQNSLGTMPFVQTEWPQPMGTLPLAASFEMGVIGIRSLAAGALTDAVDRPYPEDSELAGDVRKAQQLRFLVRGPVQTLQQAAMLFVRMQALVHTQVPGFKNAAEVEEAVATVEMPPFSEEELAQVDGLYAKGFR